MIELGKRWGTVAITATVVFAAAPRTAAGTPPRSLRSIGATPAVRTPPVPTAGVRTRLHLAPPGWQVLLHEPTGTPRTLWGGGVPIRAERADDVTADVGVWLDAHAPRLGFTPGTRRLRSVAFSAPLQTWYVDFDVLRDGWPVHLGGLQTRVQRGNLVLMHVATFPDAPVTGAWGLGEDAARASAIRQGPAPHAHHAPTRASRLLWHRRAASGDELRRAWKIETRTEAPAGLWVAFVDAETGQLLSMHNEVRDVAGTVSSEHHLRTPADPLRASAMPFVVVRADSSVAETDAEGRYTIAEGGPFATSLAGRYLQVRNLGGTDGSLRTTQPDLHWSAASATQSELDVYVFTHQVRAWAEAVAPDVPIVSAQMIAEVNAEGRCAALFRPDTMTMRFSAAGEGCNNPAQVADVVYHEWGHAFHGSSLLSGRLDPSLGEGAADTIAFLQTSDPVIAPHFYEGGAALRRVDQPMMYPEDFDEDPAAAHENGLIFAGVMWDLFVALRALEGDMQGRASMAQIFTGLLKGGPDLPGAWGEALLADDDDGDLANGTPHLCLLYDAFGAHGLGPAPRQRAAHVEHTPILHVPGGTAPEVDVALVDRLSGCLTGGVERAEVVYRVDRGAWARAPLTPEGARATGVIPALQDGRLVEYFVEARAKAGGLYTAPAAAERTPFSFVTGEVLTLRCEGFEANDGAYSAISLANDSGPTDWQWGRPAGVGDDPGAAFGGGGVWGNNLGPERGGRYPPSLASELRAAPLDTAHYTGVFLQYRRWLSVEDGLYDHAVILANGDEVWRNAAGEGRSHHIDDRWMHHVVDLGGAADRGLLQLSWALESDDSVELGGWNIDDVCVMAPATAANRLGISDFSVQRARGGGLSIAWTNPKHAPLTAVRVLRSPKPLPTGPQDGVVVYESQDPTPGAWVQFDLHESVGTRDGYAVYAFDGVDWLPWTVQGLNAARVAEGATPGCVCLDANSAPPGAAEWWVGLLFVLGPRRRRGRTTTPGSRTCLGPPLGFRGTLRVMRRLSMVLLCSLLGCSEPVSGLGGADAGPSLGSDASVRDAGVHDAGGPGGCTDFEGNLEADNQAALRRLGFALSGVVLRGRLQAQESMPGSAEFILQVSEVGRGHAGLVGQDVLVEPDAAFVATHQLPLDVVVGFARYRTPGSFSGPPRLGDSLIVASAQEGADLAEVMAYPTEGAPLVAEVSVVSSPDSLAELRVHEVLAGELPETFFVSRGFGNLADPYPAPGPARFLVSLSSLGTQDATGAWIGDVLDWRPASASARAEVRAVLASPHQDFNIQQLTEFSRDYTMSWNYHHAPNVVAATLTGLVNECCHMQDGTYIEYRLAHDFRGTWSQDRFQMGVDAYYPEEACGDQRLFAVGPLLNPVPGDRFSCQLDQDWEGPVELTRVFSILEDTPQARAQVQSWVNAPGPLLRGYPTNVVLGAEDLARPADNSPWSAPLSVPYGLSLTKLAWFRVLSAEPVGDGHRVTLETPLSPDSTERVERFQVQLAFTCADPRLLEVGRVGLMPVVADRPPFHLGNVLTDLFFAPGLVFDADGPAPEIYLELRRRLRP